MGFPGPKTANLVFTVDRKGPAFAGFFRALFERMRDGEDMLQAWVELSPQAPMERDENPELVLLPARLAYISEFIEQAKASGLVQQAIERAGLPGYKVASAKTN
jgi:hypothetical protein